MQSAADRSRLTAAFNLLINIFYSTINTIFHYALGQLVAVGAKAIKTWPKTSSRVRARVHFHFHLCPAVIIMLCLHIKTPDGLVVVVVGAKGH